LPFYSPEVYFSKNLYYIVCQMYNKLQQFASETLRVKRDT